MMNTHWNTKLTVDHIWKRLRKNYPNEFTPKTTTTIEDIRANWTTYQKLDTWFTHNKQPLVDNGLFIDTPMKLPNGEVSELTYSDSTARRIICMDESHHPLTTDTDRGGSRSISYGCDTDNRQGRRGTRGSRHISGVYTFNAFGEVLPPLFIFDSSSKSELTYKISNEWCNDLPKVGFILYNLNYIRINHLIYLLFLYYFYYT